MLLICVAIGAVIYLFALWPLVSKSGLGSRKRVRQADPNALPWEEEESYFVDDTLQGYGMEAEIRLYPEQPKLKGRTRFEATVYDGDQQRGTLEIRIRPDGTIRGSWSADFTIGPEPVIRYRTVMDRSSDFVPDNFRGNLAPWKIYEDEDGQDKSKVYLIAKGSCVLRAHNLKTGKKSNISETFYVTGWIGTDYNAAGELTTARTEDGMSPWFEYHHGTGEIEYMTFEWEGRRVD
jgi:hypothetical protein